MDIAKDNKIVFIDKDKLKIFDITKGKPLIIYLKEEYYQLTVSSDYYILSNGYKIIFIDTKTNTIVKNLNFYSNITDIKIIDEEKLLIIMYKKLQIYNFVTNQIIYKLNTNFIIDSVDISENKKYIALSSIDNLIIINNNSYIYLNAIKNKKI